MSSCFFAVSITAVGYSLHENTTPPNVSVGSGASALKTVRPSKHDHMLLILPNAWNLHTVYTAVMWISCLLVVAFASGKFGDFIRNSTRCVAYVDTGIGCWSSSSSSSSSSLQSWTWVHIWGPNPVLSYRNPNPNPNPNPNINGSVILRVELGWVDQNRPTDNSALS